jgi:phenylpropionate dioxygenase-like ring-hydroxylating dioxygenase large terminal subunit
MWLRNCWQVIAFAREIGSTPLARTVCGEAIVLFRTQSGKAAALADCCPHRFAPLSLGRVNGEQIQCGYHGMCFDAEGQCVLTGRIDRWHTNTFSPPGLHIIENGSMPAGSADKSAALERKVLNFITPETTTTTHYFWAIVRQFKIDDQELTDYIRDGITKTFDQDKTVLEAQQRIIGTDPDHAVFPVSIRVDAAPIQGRKLLASMIAREGEAPAPLASARG